MKKLRRLISFILTIALILQWTSFDFLQNYNLIAQAQESDIKVNFQTSESEVPKGYIPDYGDEYGARNGHTYGWNKDHTDVTANRDENLGSTLDTLCQFHKNGVWEIELTSGSYDVTISVGDAVYRSTNTINVEGINYWDNLDLDAEEFIQDTKNIEVNDGKLTLDQGSNEEGDTRINYIEIIKNNSQEKSSPEDIIPPSVPQNLTSQNISYDEVDLLWDSSTDNDGVEGYIIYRDDMKLATVTDSVYYKDTNLSSSTTYKYEVQAFDFSNNLSNKSESLQITTPSESKQGEGIGLKGEYYNGKSFEELIESRTDQQINFDWESGSPYPTMESDSFSIRWEGKVEPIFSEIYTFYTETHGGVRLWVNNQLLIDDWDAHSMIEKSADIELTAGQKYDIKMEYTEGSGSASAKLLWSSLSQNKEIISKNQLYPPFTPSVPLALNSSSTSTTITLKWDEVQGAEGYEIEVDGNIIDNGDSTTYIHDNLTPNTEHSYKVRSKVPGVVSDWSETLLETTKINVPQNLNVVLENNTIKITWDEVQSATEYEIEVDGTIIGNGLNTTYVHNSLMPNTEHTYKVRAKNEENVSDWSNLIRKTIPSDTPINVNATITSTSIKITWDEIDGAIGYEIEVDGNIIDNGLNTTYIHNNLTPNTQHSYRVRAKKLDGVSTWSPILTKSTLYQSGNGTGLKGEYFDNDDFTNYKLTRIDPNIEFDWKRNSPAQGVEGDEFSIRWTGQVEAMNSETHTFHTRTHGGVRLWVDNKLLIDDWEAHNTTQENGDIYLDAGKRYDIKMEYRESNGVAQAKLYWESNSQEKTIISQGQLYPIGVPQNITFDSTQTSININWDDVTYAQSYDIEVDGTVIDNNSKTSYIHNNLIPGTQHTYRVRAKNDFIIGEWSPTFTQTTLLGKPSSIQAIEATENSITIDWDSVEGAMGYEIEIDNTIINVGTVTTFKNENLSPGTLHSYRVRAKTDVVTGEWSNEIEKWTLPDIPKNINTLSNGTSITITWDDLIGSTGYDVEVYDNPIDNGNSTKYIHDGLNYNTQYTYRVRAKNSSGYGKWSSVIAKTTLPSKPTNIGALATDKDITVTWDAVAGATSYDIEIDESIVKEVTNTKYLHSGLIPNTSHTYRVRAKNSDGTSDWSQSITETTLPSIPENLSAYTTDTSITLNWDEVNGSTGYDIEVDGVVVDNGANTSYIHTGLEPNTEHTYRVRARNGVLTSFWSEEITKITVLSKSINVQAVATSTEIRVNWDTVIGAISYDIEVDGVVIDNGLSTTFIHSGLVPNTEHTYRVRAKNVSGPGEWSELISKTTLFKIPTNLTAVATSTSMTISWDEVNGATAYELLVDGEVIDNGNNTTYIHDGLEPNTWHIYRVRAKSEEFTGDWSDAITKATLVGIPTNVTGKAESNKITITWDEVSGATGYDIEVDGTVIDNGNSTTYVHSGLSSNTLHQYKIRARNENGIGNWSSMSDWSTLLNQITAPGIPQNLKATATTNEITVTWDEVDGATGYDIEVDEVIIKDIKDTSYTHTGLEPNTWHLFKVRAKNQGITSKWSEELQQNTNPEISVNVGKDNMFNFVMVAPEKKDVNTRTIVVTYNPEEVEVIDLCAVTPEINLTAGKVEGTNITVTEFTPGKIKYSISNASKTVVNSIKFIAKVNDYSKITYEIK